ncbi:hypothetical protein BDN72DRAFT_472976 [Pluteus cervinus]|uniref:Uncharacterized protein n=1 Tax=Pluteus cervinus TaxID=181527 RepID=A0ACD3A6B1_9AGAR|nr:hypothetical protein BDN72DRAFT_472976 [Pluteus cervinus]
MIIGIITDQNMTVDHPQVQVQDQAQIQDTAVPVFHITDAKDVVQAARQASRTSGGVIGPNAPVGTEGIFSSAFGLMSLNDPNMFVGLVGDPIPFFTTHGMHDDPNATPMPIPNGDSSVPKLANPLPRSSTHRNTISSPNASALWSNSPTSLFSGSQSSSKEADARELKEFWRQYMSTPLSGPQQSPFAREAKPQDGGSQSYLSRLPSSTRFFFTNREDSYGGFRSSITCSHRRTST